MHLVHWNAQPRVTRSPYLGRGLQPLDTKLLPESSVKEKLFELDMGILQIAVVGEVLPLRSCSLHLTERMKKSVGLSGGTGNM
jgi:hypothetical protein